MNTLIFKKHICKLTYTEWVPPAFQTFYSHRKCCSISSAFIRIGSKLLVDLLSQPIDSLLVFKIIQKLQFGAKSNLSFFILKTSFKSGVCITMIFFA